MSSQAIGHIWNFSPYKGAAFAIHLAIGDSANDMNDYEFWMAVSNLAKKARVSRASASAAMTTLLDDGWLEIVEDRRSGNHGKPSRYRFLFAGTEEVFSTNKKTGREPAQNLDADEDGGAQQIDRGAQNLDADETEPAQQLDRGAQQLGTNPREPNKRQEPKEPKVSDSDGYTSEFEEVWTILPNKVGKKKAFKAWKARLKQGASPDDLLAAAQNFAKAMKREGREMRFILHPATFYGPDEPWLDFIEVQRDVRNPRDNVATDREAPGGLVDPSSFRRRNDVE